jgi:hypothetical protein
MKRELLVIATLAFIVAIDSLEFKTIVAKSQVEIPLRPSSILGNTLQISRLLT